MGRALGSCGYKQKQVQQQAQQQGCTHEDLLSKRV